ncbi:MAG: glycosyltransferase family 39 protein [Candidatus Omnitrophica bacterium]|nr:glycosyltransferase family 39 protein [Candidatus Omnitrophota bacterium]
MPRRMALLIMGAIIIMGLGLRIYRFDFPSIGYHNMKENEYLSMAQEMNSTGDFISRRIYFYNPFEEKSVIRLYPQAPLITYQIIAAWKLLGENIWGPRLFNILFGVGSIIVIYFTAMLLFNNTLFALFTAFLLSFLPLAVFFSRNLQPESPAFFFMILGELCYLRFSATFKRYNLFLGGLFFSMAWLYKSSFLIGLFPVLWYFPFYGLFKERKEFSRCLKIAVASFIFIPLTIAWFKCIGQWEFQELNRVQLFAIFTPTYWQQYGKMIWWYTRGENFTLVYVILTALGIIIAFVRRKGIIDRFIMGWAVAIIPYSMVFSDYINQHNYYQMPFLTLACVASTYALFIFSEIARQEFKRYFLIFLLIAVAAGSVPWVYQSITRMHATVFLGEEVAGETLQELTDPQERIFLNTFPQGVGIARYARRYMGWPETFDDFKEKEGEFAIRYICFYPAEFARQLENKDKEMFDYIVANYHVKEVGLTENPSQLLYVILEKGEGSDPATFLQSFSGKMQLKTMYRLFGRYVFLYVLRSAPGGTEAPAFSPVSPKDGRPVWPKFSDLILPLQQETVYS